MGIILLVFLGIAAQVWTAWAAARAGAPAWGAGLGVGAGVGALVLALLVHRAFSVPRRWASRLLLGAAGWGAAAVLLHAGSPAAPLPVGALALPAALVAVVAAIAAADPYRDPVRAPGDQPGALANTVGPAGSPVQRPVADSPVALLVVHGIGQQARYETLENVAAGLAGLPGAAYQRPPGGLGLITWNGEPPDGLTPQDLSGIRLLAPGAGEVHLYEAYWAPLTQGALGARGLLAWMRRASGLGLRHVHSLVFGNRPTGGPDPDALRQDINRKLRVELLYVAVFLALAGFGAWAMLRYYTWSLAQVGALVPVRPGAGALDQVVALALSTLAALARVSWLQGALALFWAAGLYLITVTGARTVARAWDVYLTVRPTPEGRRMMHAGAAPARKALLLQDAATLALLVGTYGYVYGFTGHLVQASLVAWSIGLATLLFAYRFIREFLIAYLSDIAVYLETDENAPTYRARRAIQARAGALLYHLVQHYGQVVIVGHSLGSVIAREAIRELAIRPARSGHLPRIRALVTMGSPLRKIATLLRARDQGDEVAAPYRDTLDQDLFHCPEGEGWISGQGTIRWHNFWFLTDLVAGPLREHYPVPVGQEVRVPWPYHFYWSHSDYWLARQVMARLAGILDAALAEASAGGGTGGGSSGGGAGKVAPRVPARP